MSPHGVAILEEARAYMRRLIERGFTEQDAARKSADYFGFQVSDLIEGAK